MDVRGEALARALEWGADQVVDGGEHDVVEAVHDLTDGGADRAMDLVGTPTTVDQAVRSLAPGGRAALVGRSGAPLTTTSIARFVGDELDVVGSSGSTAQDLGELFDLIDEGRLELARSVTATIGLSDAIAVLAGDVPDTGIRTVVTGLDRT